MLRRSSGLLESQGPPDWGRFQGPACPAPSGLGSGFWVNILLQRLWGGDGGAEIPVHGLCLAQQFKDASWSKAVKQAFLGKIPIKAREVTKDVIHVVCACPGWGRQGTAGDGGEGSSHQGGARRARQASRGSCPGRFPPMISDDGGFP